MTKSDDNLVDELRNPARWVGDAALQSHFSPEAGALLAAYAEQIGNDTAWGWADTANHATPTLHSLDARGRRADRVDFHPHWHALLGTLRSSGALTLPFEPQMPQGDWRTATALQYLHGQLESGSLCPAVMTQAAVPVLARHAPALYAALHPQLHSRAHDASDAPLAAKPSLWIGMGMTERQGGSDLRACITQAQALGDSLHGCARYWLDGHKWFFSAPMSDAHLVLARSDDGPSCFFVPRWRLDGGGLNGVRLLRLKDKLGNRSNSSAEVEFHASEGLLVGEPGRGIATLVEMAGYTRLQCVMGSAALMRAGLVQALHCARHRRAFGRRLSEQPLMQQVLTDLALDSEAALHLMLRLAQAFDHRGDDGVERAWQRVLSPAAKLWVCKRAIAHTAEAMEALGGNGYVETSSLARLYREAPVNSIWEGSGNVMALDVLRAAQREPAALQAWAEAQAPLLDAPERQRLLAVCALALRPDAEPAARHVACELAQLAQAALLRQHAPATMADDFTTARLRAPGASVFSAFGTTPLAHASAHLQRAYPA